MMEGDKLFVEGKIFVFSESEKRVIEQRVAERIANKNQNLRSGIHLRNQIVKLQTQLLLLLHSEFELPYPLNSVFITTPTK